MKPDTQASLERYVQQGVPTGDFLRAVLENNLAESFGRADDINRHCLFEIVQYLHMNCPRLCWGSPQRVKVWLEVHHLMQTTGKTFNECYEQATNPQAAA